MHVWFSFLFGQFSNRWWERHLQSQGSGSLNESAWCTLSVNKLHQLWSFWNLFSIYFEMCSQFSEEEKNAPFDCSQMLWMPDVVEIHCQRPVEMKCYPDTAVWSVCVIFCSLLGSFHLSAAIALSRVQVWLTCSSSQLDTRLQHFTLLQLLSLVNCIEKVAATSKLPVGRRQRVRGGWH